MPRLSRGPSAPLCHNPAVVKFRPAARLLGLVLVVLGTGAADVRAGARSRPSPAVTRRRPGTHSARDRQRIALLGQGPGRTVSWDAGTLRVPARPPGVRQPRGPHAEVRPLPDLAHAHRTGIATTAGASVGTFELVHRGDGLRLMQARGVYQHKIPARHPWRGCGGDRLRVQPAAEGKSLISLDGGRLRQARQPVAHDRDQAAAAATTKGEKEARRPRAAVRQDHERRRDGSGRRDGEAPPAPRCARRLSSEEFRSLLQRRARRGAGRSGRTLTCAPAGPAPVPRESAVDRGRAGPPSRRRPRPPRSSPARAGPAQSARASA